MNRRYYTCTLRTLDVQNTDADVHQIELFQIHSQERKPRTVVAEEEVNVHLQQKECEHRARHLRQLEARAADTDINPTELDRGSGQRSHNLKPLLRPQEVIANPDARRTPQSRCRKNTDLMPERHLELRAGPGTPLPGFAESPLRVPHGKH